MCGWCKDKYGLWWQIVPKQLGELMGAPTLKSRNGLCQAMLKMQEIVVADLQEAYDGK